MARFHPQSYVVALENRHFHWVISWACFIALITKKDHSTGLG